MARRRPIDPLKSDLFSCSEVPRPPDPTPGSLNFGLELRSTLSRVLKESPRSRYEVAARMSELTGAEISKHQLDAWTAESREGWRFPLECGAAFEEATDTFALTELLARKRGCKVLVREEALRAELGKLELMEAGIRQQKKGLKKVMTRQGISVRESRK
ncbi:MAG: hypothetical protein K9K65_13165 [Desulfarculaceae bacterium]|nr:hypothetical protein [Desulfarculaceae bacterium]MCF8047764.1 hypothetical protein [Desulfarculaceae bacterium]MCF8066894.1 hypothetical protein [Desulfarculaceae bacterium]MCF8098784.1 hypothetical protein [Desulfarculaceae bacterium]